METAVEQRILSRREGRVMVITFNRPERKNALTVDMYWRWKAALDEAANDDAIRAVVLTGNGDAFTSGNDVLDFMNAPPAGEESSVFQLLKTVVLYEKPILTAVNGAGVGIGATLLLHTDLNYAAAGAKLQMPFVNLGLCPEAGASLLLPKMMGHARASELLLLSDKFTVEKACAYGLINEVMPLEALLPYVMEKAHAIAEKAPGSVRLTKQLLKRGGRDELVETLTFEGAHFIERLTGPEAIEAFTAFVEKRKPKFD